MEQKLEEIKNENREEADEYFEFIKSSVADGSYFKDAMNWYFSRYVSPICDRTLLIFGAVVAAVVLFFLIQMVQSAFPLVERVPIFLRAGDQSTSFPSLIELKPKQDQPGYDQSITTVDEAVAKYLLSVYVKDRESFDFSEAEIDEVNKKFNHMRSLSSGNEYKAFQLLMSKDNPNSPINFFGKNVKKVINIDSVIFSKNESQDFATKTKEYLMNKIPSEAEIRFLATTINKDDAGEVISETKERYIAKINFAFEGVKKDEKGALNFIVNSYKLYKVK